MSDRGGFGNGFWLGTLVGGVVGGIVGATIAQRVSRLDDELDGGISPRDSSEKRPLKSQLRSTDRMEMARRSLDDKISDLNDAIDAVRSTIGHVPGDAVDAIVERAEELKSEQSENPA